MSIYTKTGDKGKTSIFGGRRLLKTDLQIEAYGCIDELQSFIALVISKLKNKDDLNFFVGIEKDLYKIMANLAEAKKPNIDNNDITKLEKYIDNAEKSLPKLNKFIIPATTELSCLFNICRTICRRAERSIVRYVYQQSAISSQQLIIMKYLNRLSDLLFIGSRLYNTEKEITT